MPRSASGTAGSPGGTRSRSGQRARGDTAKPASALAPGTFGQVQPDADRPQRESRHPFPDEIRSSLLVVGSTVEQLRSDLYDDVELTNVEVAFAPKSDLEIAHTRWPDPRFLAAVHGFSHDVRQQLAEAEQELLIDRVVKGHINERHEEQSCAYLQPDAEPDWWYGEVRPPAPLVGTDHQDRFEATLR